MWITWAGNCTRGYFAIMKPHLRMNSFVGLGLMISLLVFAPEPSLAACKNSGGSSGSNSVGSQVNGSSVTICASAVAVKPARVSVVKSKVISKPKTVAVVYQKPKNYFFAQTAAPITKTPKAESKPKPKKVVAQKKIVKKVVTTPGSSAKSSAAAEFSPMQVAANVYPSDQLTVGQPASFSASALQHFRSGALLGLPTEVRFTPISVDWDFQGDAEGDLSKGSGAYLNRVFSSAGIFRVQVAATYAVAYRIKGSLNWIAEPETIAMLDELIIQVSGDGVEQVDEGQVDGSERSARLVGSDCLKRPGTFGCN
jgi:hypothetical protein